MNAIEKYAAKKKLAKGLLDLLSRGKSGALDALYGAAVPGAAINKSTLKGALTGGAIGGIGTGGLAALLGAPAGGTAAIGGIGALYGAGIGAAGGASKLMEKNILREMKILKHEKALKKLYRKGKHYAPAAAGGGGLGALLASRGK